MLTVIFGAGASYDSNPSTPPGTSAGSADRPPLANELFARRSTFEQLLDDYPEVAAIAGEFRSVAQRGSDVEEYLEALYDRSAHDRDLLCQLAAVRFYISSAIPFGVQHWSAQAHGVTNYRLLLERLRSRSLSTHDVGSLLTFNYDYLLDEAWSHTYHHDIESIDSYVDHQDAPVLLHLHGSTNWYRPITNPGMLGNVFTPKQAIAKFPDLHFGDIGYRSERNPSGISIANDERFQYGVPALTVPVRSKSHFECPERHINTMLREVLPATTKALVVGWRANERHFLTEWQASANDSLEIFIVSGDAAKGNETGQNIVNSGLKCKLHVLPYGFTELIDSLELEAILTS